MTPTIMITVDVEDWFQVENFKAWIPFDTWPQRELRVERNVHRLLDLFDSIEAKTSNYESAPGITARNPQPATRNHKTKLGPRNAKDPNTKHQTPNTRAPKVPATFFILGWVAERLPGMVREIQYRGHEVASHGFRHDLPGQLGRDDRVQDLDRSKKLLEDLTGEPVDGYRAPSFAVDDPLLEVLAEVGYRYDSSCNSFGLHDRYGSVQMPAASGNGVARRFSGGLMELPVSNLRLGGRTLPWAGGGYFRLLPTGLFIRGVRSILDRDGAYVFYMHPWEVDPGQPRVEAATRWFRFRHYVHLDRTAAKLRRLIEAFPACRFATCREYLFGR